MDISLGLEEAANLAGMTLNLAILGYSFLGSPVVPFYPFRVLGCTIQNQTGNQESYTLNPETTPSLLSLRIRLHFCDCITPRNYVK